MKNFKQDNSVSIFLLLILLLFRALSEYVALQCVPTKDGLACVHPTRLNRLHVGRARAGSAATTSLRCQARLNTDIGTGKWHRVGTATQPRMSTAFRRITRLS